MKSTKPYFKQQRNTDSHDRRKVPPKAKPTAAHTKEVPGTKADPELSDIRTTARDFTNPIDYQHPYPCMKRLAELLALQYDANRTRHAYYRQVRLIHEHSGCDPANLTEAQLREYFLFVKLTKHWKPKTSGQAVAAARMCFEGRAAFMPLQHTKFDHTSKHRKRWINEHRSGVNAALPTSALSTPIKLLRVPGSNGIPAGSSAWGRMRSRIPFKVHPPSPNGAKPHSPGQASSRRGATPWGKTPH